MGRAPCCDKMGLKKGPWSAEEDRVLVAYIMKHGHGNWRALPKQAGLSRCGKSCRLRWTNYLRPDVKRGNFSAHEQQTIIRLHQALGNRWSRIASQLPGRTDNEIKNFWNTHLKKRVTGIGEDAVRGGQGHPYVRNSSTICPAAEQKSSTPIRSNYLYSDTADYRMLQASDSGSSQYSQPEQNKLVSHPYSDCSSLKDCSSDKLANNPPDNFRCSGSNGDQGSFNRSLLDYIKSLNMLLDSADEPSINDNRGNWQPYLAVDEKIGLECQNFEAGKEPMPELAQYDFASDSSVEGTHDESYPQITSSPDQFDSLLPETSTESSDSTSQNRLMSTTESICILGLGISIARMAISISLNRRKCLQNWVGLVYLFGLLMLCSGRKTLEARRLAGAEKYHAVNLGGWLVTEGWIKPSLFDGIPDNDLLDGTQIQLKSIKLGTYVVAEGGGGQIIAVNRTNPSGWETFKIWRVKDGVYNLRVFNKQFIGADNGGGGAVNAVATTPKAWETFQIIRNPSNRNRVHIAASNGMYLQAENKDQLTADFKGEPGWDDNNAATFEMTIIGVMRGEYQITNGYGPQKARQVLNEHWNTFVTEDDFVFLSKNGINAVRIPVGWWIASDPNPPAPFVGGSLQALDKAFTWAGNHGIKVIVDLHAAPGSQNGDEHSGSRDGSIEWATSQDNIDQSLSAIDFLAARYAKNPALLGVELLNEPRAPAIDLQSLTSYYSKGYATVRKHSPTAYVIMCNRIGPADPKELFQMNNGLSNTVVDVHYYNLFDDSLFKKMTVQDNIDYINNNRSSTLNSLITGNGPLIIVGEWVAEWEVQGASKSDYQRFGDAQLQVYGKASFGWAYWTLKNVQNHWSFEWMVQNQYLRP